MIPVTGSRTRPGTLGLDSVRIEKAGENRLAMAPETSAANQAMAAWRQFLIMNIGYAHSFSFSADLIQLR